ncbi:hypothetical protein [Natronoglycomyces albus]|uniref:Uncharacterized protein n=1 Tax=Natronoglycomyces albus TaxID=2811108 RepID=A0A895XLC3_9ACTN|nr:hypothetical protein [Natronoglycomyces albus]QSB06134.1 hypothetical protein JQS30_04235 [Natronoglycomyces albus]
MSDDSIAQAKTSGATRRSLFKSTRTATVAMAASAIAAIGLGGEAAAASTKNPQEPARRSSPGHIHKAGHSRSDSPADHRHCCDFGPSRIVPRPGGQAWDHT